MSLFLLPLKLINRTISIVRHVVSFKPTVVISHHDDANISLLPSLFLLKYLFRKKIFFIAYIHNGNYSENLLTRLIAVVIRWMYKHFDAVVTVSQGNREVLERRFHLKNLQVFYNPIDFTKIQGLANDTISLPIAHGNIQLTLCTIARLTYQKGLDLVLKSLALLKKTYGVSFSFRLIGEGELKDELQALAKELNIQEEVMFLGMQTNVFPFIKACDVFVLNSRRESFGQVLVEALALNKLVISSDCNVGPREILAPEIQGYEQKLTYPYFGKYGVLTNHPDEQESTEKLAALLHRCVTEPSIAKQYSNGLERAKDFDIETMKKEYERFFTSFDTTLHNH